MVSIRAASTTFMSLLGVVDGVLHHRQIPQVARPGPLLGILPGSLEENPHGVDEGTVVPPDPGLVPTSPPGFLVPARVVPGPLPFGAILASMAGKIS